MNTNREKIEAVVSGAETDAELDVTLVDYVASGDCTKFTITENLLVNDLFFKRHVTEKQNDPLDFKLSNELRQYGGESVLVFDNTSVNMTHEEMFELFSALVPRVITMEIVTSIEDNPINLHILHVYPMTASEFISYIHRT